MVGYEELRKGGARRKPEEGVFSLWRAAKPNSSSSFLRSRTFRKGL